MRAVSPRKLLARGSDTGRSSRRHLMRPKRAACIRGVLPSSLRVLGSEWGSSMRRISALPSLAASDSAVSEKWSRAKGSDRGKRIFAHWAWPRIAACMSAVWPRASGMRGSAPSSMACASSSANPCLADWTSRCCKAFCSLVVMRECLLDLDDFSAKARKEEMSHGLARNSGGIAKAHITPGGE